MLRDVFYFGTKPNVHPKEQPAKNLVDARKKATTEHFWIINEFCDYTNFDWDFDFEFLPDSDVWAEDHNNVWPSLHQKDSGTWLCANNNSDVIVYRCDVEPLKRKNIVTDNWKLLENIDTAKWDFSWHPDPTDPPFIYKWGSKYAPAELSTCLEYHVPGATDIKYMNTIVELLPNWDSIVEVQKVDSSRWDMSWRPDPMDPPYIYVWGNKYVDGKLRATLEYHVPGATEKKYMNELVPVLPEWERWDIIHDVDKTTFDFSWRPDPREPDFIYVFGNDQYEAGVMPTIEYHMSNATERKYLHDMKAKLSAHAEKFEHLEKADGIDYSWVPDPTAPPYIYAWGNQWNKPEDKVSIQYVVEGATEYKFMEARSKRKPCMDNWEVPANVDTTGFDFSWEPSPADPAFIYEFGTQWQKTGGPRYVVEGATEVKYVEFQKVKALSTIDGWTIPTNCDVTGFDFSWHPDSTSPPYTYHFATQWALTGGPIYNMEGATEVKYVEHPSAVALPSKENWDVPNYIDSDAFDFSWHPYVEDQPYVYQFGTQHQKTGGPRYITPGVIPSSPVKYIDTRIIRSIRKPGKKNFAILNNYKIKEFDWSWHPDDTDEPYIYVFGNTQHPAEIMPTVEYKVPGAKQIKYVSDVIAVLDVDMTNWEVTDNVDTTGFDFSWKPNPKDPAFIYEFSTQWQKTGGPRYIVPDATEVKYVTTQQVKALPDHDKWTLPENIDVTDFDFSWHPDSTSPPYNYHFATQWALSGGPVYKMDGAIATKYMDSPSAKALPNKTNWEVPVDIDDSDFDFSWHPYAEDDPYIYQFGTQWQKTGGPRYVTPGAKRSAPVKYIDTRIITSKKLPTKSKFTVLNNLSVASFDWSWHPDDTDGEFIYVFGNTQYPAEVMPTIEYRSSPYAEKTKYVNDVKATLATDLTGWDVPSKIDVSQFDFSWKPNPNDPPYIYQFGTQHQKTGGPKYTVSGATEVKYVEGSTAKALASKKHWVVPATIDGMQFDFSWHPDETEELYVYQFGTQWQKTGGPRYVTFGSTSDTPVKYCDDVKSRQLPNKKNFTTLVEHEIKDFDYSWHPDDTDKPYIYVFGNKQYSAEIMPTVEYKVPGAVQVKYINDVVATLNNNKKNWDIPKDIITESFDFSWLPHPKDPPFIYQFGTQWQKTGGPRYVVPTATDIKYVDDLVAKRKQVMTNWIIPENIESFDFSWHPDETAPPFIYEFATTWNNRGGPQYNVPGATQKKYVEDVKAKLKQSRNNWLIADNVNVDDFDFSWIPHPDAPSYIYQFGTVVDDNDGPRYVTPNNNGEVVFKQRISKPVQDEATIEKVDKVFIGQYYIETTLEDLVNKHPDEIFWALNSSIDYTNFDFTWRPEIIHIAWESAYVNVFGSPDSPLTQTYFVNAKSYLSGKKDFKFVEDVKLSEEYLSTLFVKPDIFFVDRGNSESSARFEIIKAKFGNVQKTRYLNSWVDTINRCINRSTTELCWILNSELDYTGFDFNYYPNPWQMKMVHVFGTQWSHWGTTFMVNRETFSADTKYIKIIEHLSNLNFVKNRTAKATNVLYDVYYIDHSNTPNLPVANVVPYDTDYLTTFKNIISKLPEKKEQYIWIASTVCDYEGFDFTYICDPFAREQLHVFPSDRQKFGDTFLVNVNKLRELITDMESLKDYDKINFNQHQRTKRLAAPVIVSDFDSHVATVMQDFDFPYATFVTNDNKDIAVVEEEPMNLWDIESKNILITSTGGTRIVVPKEAKQYVETQLYDYPYIKTAPRLAKSNPLDIVFLSNGEACADENYEHLLKATKGLPNRIVRVDGVNGRVEAYHAAAEASNTPWMFTVFAKLKVNTKFDFNWQPDRLQIPKHYMFLAKNPVNGLIYGHQGMIAYNKQMTLDNPGYGLDFTLDSPHETIELLSGIATYNTDEWSTWRTAFREVIKLKKEDSEISNSRLEVWLTKATGDFAQSSLDGAKDGIDYYNEVDGKTDKLKLSYEWAWLRERFNK